jgi:hypothetical protein
LIATFLGHPGKHPIDTATRAHIVIAVLVVAAGGFVLVLGLALVDAAGGIALVLGPAPVVAAGGLARALGEPLEVLGGGNIPAQAREHIRIVVGADVIAAGGIASVSAAVLIIRDGCPVGDLRRHVAPKRGTFSSVRR